jgi:chemotaxis protein histidine kinase CheA
MGDPLKRVKHISGATILGSGKVVMILDVPSIIHSAEGGVVRPVSGSSHPSSSRHPLI